MSDNELKKDKDREKISKVVKHVDVVRPTPSSPAILELEPQFLLNPTFKDGNDQSQFIHDDRGSRSSDSPIFLSPITSEEEILFKNDGDGFWSPVKEHGTFLNSSSNSTQSSAYQESLHGKLNFRQNDAREERSDQQGGETGDTEKTPLLKSSAPQGGDGTYRHTNAYEMLTKLPVLNRVGNQFDNDENEEKCWCCRKDTHPMASAFTNATFRQKFTAKVLKFKVIQMSLCFLVAISSQVFWTWQENEEMGTPKYVLLVEEHRWIVLIPLTTYVLLIFFIRVSHFYGRGPPLNFILFSTVTFLLCLMAYAGSVGFAAQIHAGVVPVVLGGLALSYSTFYLLVIPKERWPLRVEVTNASFYYIIVPITSFAAFASWAVVFGILLCADSVVSDEDAVGSFLWEATPVLPIVGLCLLMDVYHVKGILEGTRVSILTDDMSEALFAFFYV